MAETAAAKVPGVQQPHVSLLMRYRASTFSVGRLRDFLTALDTTWKSRFDADLNGPRQTRLIQDRSCGGVSERVTLLEI